MRYALNADQMKRADDLTQKKYKVPSCVLMERAAYSVFEVICERVDKAKGPVIIACGVGNNGGDGLALARMLFQEGYTVLPFMVGNIEKCSEECSRQLEILKAYGIEVGTEVPGVVSVPGVPGVPGITLDITPGGRSTDIAQVDITPSAVVDAIFGIGLSREITGSYAEKIDALNALPGLKVAVDIPSGISADTGAVLRTAFEADITVTFGFAKTGHLVCPGRVYSGELIIAQIGIDLNSLDEDVTYTSFPIKSDLSRIPRRIPDSNKGTYGRVLSVTGSKNMAGAALFVSKSAYMMGAGLVCIFTPEDNRVIMQTGIPEAVLISYDSDSARTRSKLESAVDTATVIAAGSGLSMSGDAAEILKTILSYGQAPLVLDADGLNLVASSEELSHLLTWYPGRKVLTPHVKEAARLLRSDVENIKKDLIESAKAISAEYRCECVLKDSASVAALSDGRIIINASGNNSMAKGGSGDVLTGIIAGLISTGAKPSDAAWLGMYIHGLAGEEASRVRGTRSVLATDIIDGISEVLKDA